MTYNIQVSIVSEGRWFGIEVGIEEIGDHGYQPICSLYHTYMRSGRYNRQTRFRQPVEVAHSSASFGTKEVDCMLIPDTIGIPYGDKYRSLNAFCLAGPIVGLQVDADYFFDVFIETGRIISETIVLLLDGRALEHVCSKVGKGSLYVWPPTIVRVSSRYEHQPSYLGWVARCNLKGNTSAHAVSQYVGAVYFKVLKQAGYIVCHAFITKLTRYIFRAAVTLQFSDDDLPVF